MLGQILQMTLVCVWYFLKLTMVLQGLEQRGKGLLAAWLTCTCYMVHEKRMMALTNMAFYPTWFPSRQHGTHEFGIQTLCFKLLILILQKEQHRGRCLRCAMVALSINVICACT